MKTDKGLGAARESSRVGRREGDVARKEQRTWIAMSKGEKKLTRLRLR